MEYKKHSLCCIINADTFSSDKLEYTARKVFNGIKHPSKRQSFSKEVCTFFNASIISSFFSPINGKDASVTVDCIDWNSVVDLSRHPLGPPYKGTKINIVKKEIDHTAY